MTNTNVSKGHGLGPGAILLHSLAKHWWVLALRGVAAIVFGILAFAWPGITVVSLVILYGAYALVDGVFSIFAAIGGGNNLEAVKCQPDANCRAKIGVVIGYKYFNHIHLNVEQKLLGGRRSA